VHYRASSALLQRQSGLGAVKRLDLGLLINREDQRLVELVEIKPDHATAWEVDHLPSHGVAASSGLYRDMLGLPAALSREPEERRKLAEMRCCSCSSGCELPLLRGFAPEQAQRAAGDQVALEIECVVDRGVSGEEALS
jgi:hypothetical protein